MKKQRNLPGFIVALALSIFLSGCTATSQSATVHKSEYLSFKDINKISLDVSSIEIVNQYDSTVDQRDMSSLFPVQPDIAMRRFAENRLQANGSAGRLAFVIENAAVHHTAKSSENGIVNWLGSGEQDEYEVLLRVRLSYFENEALMDKRSSVFSFRRTLSIPASLSIAEREDAQAKLIRTIIDDADKVITEALTEKMNLQVPPDFSQQDGMKNPSVTHSNDRQNFIHDVLTAPELR